MDAHDIACSALQAFEKETGLKANALSVDGQHDECALELAEHRLNGQIQPWASHNTSRIFQRFIPAPDTLLVADYVNANLADKLREAGIQFIDTAGNAFIDLPALKIRIKGNRPERTAATPLEDSAERAFQPKGLIVIYHLLTDEQMLMRSMRDIAKLTGVAHGTAAAVLNVLEKATYLRRDRRRRLVIHDRTGLIERWVQGYAEKLAPKLLFGYFLDETPDWWGAGEIESLNGVWGGEVAAREYTHYLQPQIATLYVPGDMRAALMQRRRLRQASKGTDPNIKLMRRFWHDEDERLNVMASPLLTYAELIASGDSRNLEAARMIYDNYLASS